MPVTVLDPRTALIVVDLQQGILGVPAIHPIAGVVQRSVALVEAFRHKRLPVVLVNADGGAPGRTERPSRLAERPTGWTDLLPDLDLRPTDHLVTKRTWGSFTQTDLEAYLQRECATQVVVVGVATSAGVESTARHAHELGFNVTLATDAMTDVSAEAHENSVTRIFPRLGETGTAQQILDLLEGR
jgi:nicotinamidase-related amidase